MEKSRCRRWLVLAATAATVFLPAAAAEGAGFTPLHIPAGARHLGALAQATTLHATLALAPRDVAGLAAYARAVTTPGSPFYHRYLSVAAFARRFGPGPAQIAQVRRALAAAGLTPGTVSASHLTLSVTGRAHVAAAAFSTSFERYTTSGGQSGYASTTTPSVPRAITGLVQGVIGLDSVAPTASAVVHLPRHRSGGAQSRPSAAADLGASGPHPCAAAQAAGANGAGYTADQIASEYGLTNDYAGGNQGRNETVALYELEPFSASDIAAYQACYATNASVTTVPVDGGAGRGSGSGEAAMDVEDVIGLAPGAAIKVYEGPATGAGAYDTYSRIVSDNSAQVVSTAWGLCEALEGAVPAAAESSLFQEAAVQGQTILAAAGDLGSDDCGDHRQTVDDPASQPWVTAVGGTSLQGAQNVVWNDALGATGGGVSRLWGRPSYQDGITQPQSQITCRSSGTACRELPDLSVHGDPATGYVIYFLGAWRIAGGTSIAAPTVAALTALADASPVCGGHSVGFLNPELYRAAALGYAANFQDITSGTNGFGSVAGYPAGPGYDMASGLGAPTAALGLSLCGVSLTLRAPKSLAVAAGHFTTAQATASEPSASAVSYAATGLPVGLAIGRSTGRIAGTPRIAGYFTVTITATNAAGGVATASFPLTVTAVGPGTGTPVTQAVTASLVRGHHARGRRTRVGVAVRVRVRVPGLPARGLIYTATGLPRGLRINRGTGQISGRPQAAGATTVRVRAIDGRGRVATVAFRWTIRAA